MYVVLKQQGSNVTVLWIRNCTHALGGLAGSRWKSFTPTTLRRRTRTTTAVSDPKMLNNEIWSTKCSSVKNLKETITVRRLENSRSFAVAAICHKFWASRSRPPLSLLQFFFLTFKSNQIKSHYLLRRPSSVAQGRKYRPTTTCTMEIPLY